MLKDNEALRNFFSTHSSKLSDQTLQLVVRTFKVLCENADFEAESEPAPPAAQAVVPETVRAANPAAASVQAVVATVPGTPSININIELHLPATNDATIYEKLFAALHTSDCTKVLVDNTFASILGDARAFEDHAHLVLATHEAAESRIVLLENTYEKLARLNVKQDDLLRQALRCIENSLFRAAHVMAWAALMDFVEEKLVSDGLAKLRAIRPSWKGRDIRETAEYITERQLIEVTKDLGLCTKNEVKTLVGLLERRNECAHPTEYYPDLNETLGYVAETLQRISALQLRVL